MNGPSIIHSVCHKVVLRDWSLITGRGGGEATQRERGATKRKRGGGACKVLPC